MSVIIQADRKIRGDGDACPEGRLEIIEDVDIPLHHYPRVLAPFSVPTSIINMMDHSAELWQMICDCRQQNGNILFLCPGNGAWLVERALNSLQIYPKPVQPVDISRDGATDIHIKGNPERIIVLEDIVETGSTARKILQKLAGSGCPVTLAAVLWHDREAQTNQVIEVLSGYDQVLIPVRIRSNHELDDVRSLSTLARKNAMFENQRYSRGKEGEFITTMKSVLDYAPWLRDLGKNIGYRRDEYSVSLAE